MNRHIIASIDFETTGKDASTSPVTEFGFAVQSYDPIIKAWTGINDGGVFTSGAKLFNPGVPIPPETSAVHHIIDEDVEDSPLWSSQEAEDYVASVMFHPGATVVLVAHNNEYEKAVIAARGIDLSQHRWVCTYKCALVAFPKAPSHSNESLRYYLKLPNRGRRASSNQAHSAGHDAYVTLQIMFRLLEEFSLDELVAISDQPAQLPNCPIGKHRGEPWSDLPHSYLSWMVKQADMREDVLHCAKAELNRRANT